MEATKQQNWIRPFNWPGPSGQQRRAKFNFPLQGRRLGVTVCFFLFYLFSWNNHRIMISRQHRTLEKAEMNEIAQFGDAGRVTCEVVTRHFRNGKRHFCRTQNCRFNYLSICRSVEIFFSPKSPRRDSAVTWWPHQSQAADQVETTCVGSWGTRNEFYTEKKSGQTFVLEQSRAGHLIRTGCRWPRV